MSYVMGIVAGLFAAAVVGYLLLYLLVGMVDPLGELFAAHPTLVRLVTGVIALVTGALVARRIIVDARP